MTISQELNVKHSDFSRSNPTDIKRIIHHDQMEFSPRNANFITEYHQLLVP